MQAIPLLMASSNTSAHSPANDMVPLKTDTNYLVDEVNSENSFTHMYSSHQDNDINNTSFTHPIRQNKRKKINF